MHCLRTQYLNNYHNNTSNDRHIRENEKWITEIWPKSKCTQKKNLKCTKRQDQPKSINTEHKEFEQVKSFKYVRLTVNTIEEEIKERIALWNKAFFANKKMFQSKLISKMAK